MHVVYIHQHFSTTRGTTGTRSYEMSQRLLRAGHRVTMICGVHANNDVAVAAAPRVSESLVDGIVVKTVAEPYGNEMGFLRRVRAFRGFADTAAKIVKELDADLVFATSTPLTVGLPGMKGARHLGVPFVFEVRDLWPEIPIAVGVIKNPLLKWYTRRMERRIYQAAQRIIALAPGMKEGICRTNYPAERVTMIPNGCDLELFRPRAERSPDARFGDPDRFRLVFTGAHGLLNGLDAVLDAAVELERRGVSDVQFVFIGGGREKPRLMERAGAQRLDDLVCWVDPIPKQELAGVLPQMDAGLMILKNVRAFYRGTSPNKFFDYIASGLPVLNNYPGWLAEMITERDCGCVVPPDDPVAFCDAVLRLRDHPEQGRQMGLRGRQLAEERFSRDRLGDEFVATLERAYDERNDSGRIRRSSEDE
ncbi:MAG: glycosyltransferase family 4 protein [Planctomycetes bacterium]|nr:glycosyltransferase family 4 protein [Planctomycetota bacterium]